MKIVISLWFCYGTRIPRRCTWFFEIFTHFNGVRMSLCTAIVSGGSNQFLPNSSTSRQKPNHVGWPCLFSYSLNYNDWDVYYVDLHRVELIEVVMTCNHLFFFLFLFFFNRSRCGNGHHFVFYFRVLQRCNRMEPSLSLPLVCVRGSLEILRKWMEHRVLQVRLWTLKRSIS